MSSRSPTASSRPASSSSIISDKDRSIVRHQLLIALALAAVAPLAAQTANPAQLRHARALHHLVPMIDGHNDFAWEVRQQLHGSFEGHDMAAGLPPFTGTDSLGHDIGFMTD